MKKYRCTLALLIAAVLLLITASCHPPVYKKTSGPIVTRSYNFSGFTGVETGFAFKVDIAHSDTYDIIITTNEDVFEYLDIRTVGDTLKIDARSTYWTFHNPLVTITITMPEISNLDLSGASEGNVSGFKSEKDFELALSGASELALDIETGNFKAELSGASELEGSLSSSNTELLLSGSSDCRLKGSGADLELTATGASSAELEDFYVNNAGINLSGASDAVINLSGAFNAVLSGASFLEYRGKGKPGSIETSGGSSYTFREE